MILYTSGQAAKKLGVTLSTVVHAENHGFKVKHFHPSRPTWRMYDDDDIEELKKYIPTIHYQKAALPTEPLNNLIDSIVELVLERLMAKLGGK